MEVVLYRRTFKVVMSIANCAEDPFNGIGGVPQFVFVENSALSQTYDLKVPF